METGPNAGLAQGEMIKFFSLFYNDEEVANELFEEIEVLVLFCCACVVGVGVLASFCSFVPCYFRFITVNQER